MQTTKISWHKFRLRYKNINVQFEKSLRLLNTREIPAFGGISLALRGNGATFRAPSSSIWRRLQKRKKLYIGAPTASHDSGAFGAPFSGRLQRP